MEDYTDLEYIKKFYNVDYLMEGDNTFNYSNENIEDIASELGRHIKLSQHGLLEMDIPGQYCMNYFDEIGIIDDKLLVMRQNKELTDIIMVPKKMIVHLNGDAKKNYIMLISGKGIEENIGIDYGNFEHIKPYTPHMGTKSVIRPYDCWELINIYKENVPMLIHYVDSVYNTDTKKRDKLLFKHEFPNSNN